MNVHAAALAEAHLPDEQTSAFAARRDRRPVATSQAPVAEIFLRCGGLGAVRGRSRVLPEYYPTRTELGILRRPRRRDRVHHSRRARRWWNSAPARPPRSACCWSAAISRAYVPVDISGDFLNAQANGLRKDFPELGVYPVAADFTAPFALPAEVAGHAQGRLLSGIDASAISSRMKRSAFLRSARDILGKGAQMIIGADLEKNERVLYDAYNDAAGVTARFNLNVLVRINRELGGNFDVSAFMHRSIYNRERHRIEMHLIAKKAQTVRILGTNFSFRPGESIHTETSYKYSLDRFTALARASGWSVRESWTDRDRMFSVHALVASD